MLNLKRLLALFLFLPLVARAGDRTIDMTALIKDPDGQPIRDQLSATPEDPLCKLCGDLTIGRAIAHALLWTTAGDEKVSADQKFTRGLMAERLRDNKAAALDASETAAIERLMARLYGPAILFPVMQAIDPNAKTEHLQ